MRSSHVQVCGNHASANLSLVQHVHMWSGRCRARHREHVHEALEALQQYVDVYMELDVAAEELRAAARALGRVTGLIGTEDVLDKIFQDFCVGK